MDYKELAKQLSALRHITGRGYKTVCVKPPPPLKPCLLNGTRRWRNCGENAEYVSAGGMPVQRPIQR